MPEGKFDPVKRGGGEECDRNRKRKSESQFFKKGRRQSSKDSTETAWRLLLNARVLAPSYESGRICTIFSIGYFHHV